MSAVVEAKKQENKTFYPTPPELVKRMCLKIRKNPDRILDPSAGKGDLLEGLSERHYIDLSSAEAADYGKKYRIIDFSSAKKFAMEIDPDLQNILVAKHYKLVDNDFLAFAGPDQFDLIIANPPFDEGDQHLLKAISMMYCGQILFLLNAETIRNPYTNTRKELAKKLKELNAEIEFISGAFRDAERQTSVDVALINIMIERKIEDDLFADTEDRPQDVYAELHEANEVSTGKTIEELVLEYNQIVQIGKETILAFFKNYPKIWKYINLNAELQKYRSNSETLTKRMHTELNAFLHSVRTDFWRRTLDIPQVKKRMTADRLKEFEFQLESRSNMDFTENNIRQFIINLIDTYEESLFQAVLKLFDKMTISHCYDDGLVTDNIHYYNGWKTNKAFKVNKKVILPVYGSYHCGKGPFVDEYSGKWKLQWSAGEDLFNDIDIVMNYFDALNDYCSVRSALERALDRQQNRNIESTYFTFTVYKKGTIHLTFNDDDIWRRFNVAAGIGKNFLPQDYGKKSYREMNKEEQAVVQSFEGPVSYERNRHIALFHPKNRPALPL